MRLGGVAVSALMSMLLLLRAHAFKLSPFQSWTRSRLPPLHRTVSLLTVRHKDVSLRLKARGIAPSTGSTRSLAQLPKSFEDWRNTFHVCIRAKDHDGAVQAFHEMAALQPAIQDHDYMALLGVCYKAEHLPLVLSTMEKLKGKPVKRVVSLYVALIRCSTDAGRLNEAVNIIQDLVSQKLELRPRVFQPLLDALSAKGDVARSFAVLKYMIALKVVVNEEQLVPLVSLLGHPNVCNKLQTDLVMSDTFHAIMREVSRELLGVYRSNAQQAAQGATGLTAKQVEDQGILVETAEDIKGDVLESTLAEDGRLIAHNISYPTMKTSLVDVISIMENERSQYTPNDAQSVPENYTVLYENGTRALLSSHLSSSTDCTNPVASRFQRSRIVSISSRTCRCPNCDLQITPIGLSEQEKQHVRDELFKLVRMSRGNMLHNLNVSRRSSRVCVLCRWAVYSG
jgi:hypothetical protein